MHINYKGQFSDKPASRVRKIAAASDGLDHPDTDEDNGLLDVDEEEDQGHNSGQSGSRRGNHAGSSGQAEEAEGTRGRWATHNNHKVTERLLMTTLYSDVGIESCFVNECTIEFCTALVLSEESLGTQMKDCLFWGNCIIFIVQRTRLFGSALVAPIVHF